MWPTRTFRQGVSSAVGKLKKTEVEEQTPVEESADTSIDFSCPIRFSNSSSCVVKCKIDDVPVENVLVDTGSTVSILNVDMVKLSDRKVVQPCTTAAQSVNSKPLNVVGSAVFKVELDGHSSNQTFLLVTGIWAPVILGVDFLKSNDVSVTFDTGKGCVAVKPSANISTPDQCASVTVSPRIMVAKTCIIPANHLMNIECQASQPVEGDVFCVEGLPTFLEKHSHLEVGDVIINADQAKQSFQVPIANHGHEDITLYSSTNIALIEALQPDSVVDSSECSEQCGACNSTINSSEEERQKELRNYVDMQDHLSCDQKETLLELMIEFSDIFALNGDTLGYCTVYPHKICTGNALPIKQAARRLPHHKRNVLKEIIDDLLQKGIITESSSPWASPIVMVGKKDGSFRLCVDYRKLNHITVRDAYPLPRIDETIDSLHGCSLFSTFDLISGYWQLELDEEDRCKSAFSTPMGLFQFNVLPMGVCNGPATFQRAMERVLNELLTTSKAPICRVFFDDVAVASSSTDDHFAMLRQVFSKLRTAHLKLKLSKCHFLRDKVDFLGFRVSKEGVSTCEDKVNAVKDWPVPRNASETKQFLGLASYYRKFVKNFSKVASPLHAVTAKNNKFEWNKSCQASFRLLKERLVNAPILAYPNLSEDAEPFVLDTDASNYGMGAVLSQRQDGKERVIAYASKILSKTQRNYHTYDRELLACATFIDHFRCYLIGKPFKLRTDHDALTSLLKSSEPKGRRARWLEKLTDYDFEIIHRPGKAHQNADALSRLVATPEVVPAGADKDIECNDGSPLVMDNVAAVVSPPTILIQPAVEMLSLDDLRSAQLADTDIQRVLSWYDHESGSFDQPPETVLVGTSQMVRRFASEISHFLVVDDILWRRSQVEGNDLMLFVVPELLKTAAVSSTHDLPGGGHLGFDKTLAKCKARFFWYGMSTFVKLYISTCLICEQSSSKVSHGTAPLGNMIAGYRFERVSLDIVGPLPISARGHRYILVAIDCFTRWAQAFPLMNMTAESVAEAFVEGWVALFGVPESLHSDQGSQFTSKVFHEMCKMLNISKTQTTPYHPQGNGMVERVNRTIINLLRANVHDNESNWDKVLPLVMLSYRSAVHRSTGFTPAKMMLGAELRIPADLVFGLPEQVPSQVSSQFVVTLEKSMQSVFEQARQNDLDSHVVQSDHYNLRARGKSYAVNDVVWLLDTAIPRGSGEKKLKWPWKGPYEVIEARDPVYCIKSQLDNSISRVHFNRLKACRSRVPDTQPVSAPASDSSASLAHSFSQFEQWPDEEHAAPAPPPQPPPAPPPPPPPPPVNPRGHLQRNVGLPSRLNNYVVPPPAQR